MHTFKHMRFLFHYKGCYEYPNLSIRKSYLTIQVLVFVTLDGDL